MRGIVKHFWNKGQATQISKTSKITFVLCVLQKHSLGNFLLVVKHAVDLMERRLVNSLFESLDKQTNKQTPS